MNEHESRVAGRRFVRRATGLATAAALGVTALIGGTLASEPHAASASATTSPTSAAASSTAAKKKKKKKAVVKKVTTVTRQPAASPRSQSVEASVPRPIPCANASGQER